jgi:hypothetical protein
MSRLSTTGLALRLRSGFRHTPIDVLRVAGETAAVPYDIPGVAFSRIGERCSFAAFIAKYRPEGDAALARLAGHRARR